MPLPHNYKTKVRTIRELLNKYKIKPDPLKDQFFLNDENIIKKVVDYGNLTNRDTVLEIGAGTGSLTNEIAKKAGRVVAFEIDKKFKPFLDKLPKNVEIHYEDAWSYIQLHGKFRKRKTYNKIISNIPYSFAEKFLHNLTFLEYDKTILVVPLKFVNKVNENGIFASFFRAEVKLYINKEKFFPIPRTNSAVIDLIKLPDPVKNKNSTIFLRQYVYQHEQQLVKNSLVEGIIKYAWLAYTKKITKNQSRKIIADKTLDENLLDKLPRGGEIYNVIAINFANLNDVI